MRKKRGVVVFGGTFDPFHEGHVSALRQLMEIFHLVLIAPTSQNPFKERQPTSAALRREMIRLVLAAEGIPLSASVEEGGVMLCEIDYVYSRELAEPWLNEYGGELFWAMGPEIVREFPKWSGGWTKDHVTPHVVAEEIQLHASDIRGGQRIPHPAIRALIEREGLYGPSG